jgi:sensor histidine kinase YesM
VGNIAVGTAAHRHTKLMIKDTFLKVLLIPLLGILIPLYSGLFAINNHRLNAVILSVIFFLITSYIIWDGLVRIIAQLRNNKIISRTIFSKLMALGLIAAAYSALVMLVAGLLWQQLFLRNIYLPPVLNCCVLYAAAALFITPVYEAAFLSKERELDVKIVDQLDNERRSAEIHSLKSELDPHFIFNSLTTLSHLIYADAEKAYRFNQKLAQVYKYFLINKDRELISIHHELEFIEDYFFLLQIRHDEKLQLHITFNSANGGTSMILPYALQVLVENAIKHNEFSERDPLHIAIDINSHYVHVVNNLKPKPYLINSTHIGLKNLSNRYRMICNKDIIIENTNSQFAVRLPLITQKT